MLNNNRDRGTKKWVAMMLPEHVVKIKEWVAEDDYTERPDLDDWELQQIQEEIEVAYKSKCQTLIKTWVDGKIIHYQGTIKEIDLHLRIIMLQDPFGIERIPVEKIISVQSLN